MTFPFTAARELGAGPRRPLVSVVVDRLDESPLLCLVDTGSLRSRLPGWLAEELDLDLAAAPSERIALGGQVTVARQAHVVVRAAGVEAPCSVWFCDEFAQPFGLLGQEDCLRLFRLRMSAAHEWFELRAERLR